MTFACAAANVVGALRNQKVASLPKLIAGHLEYGPIVRSKSAAVKPFQRTELRRLYAKGVRNKSWIGVFPLAAFNHRYGLFIGVRALLPTKKVPLLATGNNGVPHCPDILRETAFPPNE